MQRVVVGWYVQHSHGRGIRDLATSQCNGKHKIYNGIKERGKHGFITEKWPLAHILKPFCKIQISVKPMYHKIKSFAGWNKGLVMGDNFLGMWCITQRKILYVIYHAQER